MSNEHPARSGWEIPVFVYESGRHLLIPEEANRVVTGLNRIHRLEIVRGNSDAVIISDDKVTIQLKRAGETAGAANMFYRGEYAANKLTTFLSGQHFIVGHIVRVQPGNPESTTGAGGTIPGVYICAQDNPSASDKPKHPLQAGGETAFWHWMSTWPYETIVCDEEGETPFFVDGQEDPD